MLSVPSSSRQFRASPKTPGRLGSKAGHILARLTLVAGALSFIAALLTVYSEARALDLMTKLKSAGDKAWGGAPKDVGVVVGNIILVVVGLLGVVFVVLLVYGGFLWLTSAGEEDKTKKATGIIVNAVIGTLIVAAAYSITYFVLSRIGAAL